jgi:hypothetical protein
MLNCRSIPPEAWEHARQALVFYFSRRHGSWGAEDLAQETLTAILSREDYLFEREEDFLRVCYGFAAHVLQTARRDPEASLAGELPGGLSAAAAGMRGLKHTEVAVYLHEILQVGSKRLRDSDWKLIRNAAGKDPGPAEKGGNRATEGKARVKLHRARRKLAELTGWRKSEA